MKKAILLFIILIIGFSAEAMCGWSGIRVWPSQKNISTNSIFIIEGYGQSQELIKQLNKKNKIYLKCNSEIVPIKVIRILEGQYRLTQAILKPERELRSGKTYELHIDSLGKIDKSEYEVVKWTVNSINDDEKPVWNCEPTYKTQRYVGYGCGPERYVYFCGSYNDNSPTVIYAKVFDKTNETSSDYFITSEDNKISIGHGMCAGEFTFDDESNYEVQFGLMDASGNENLALTSPIHFTSPTEDNQSDLEFNCSCNEKSSLLIYCFLVLGLIVVILLVSIKLYKRKKSI